MRIITIHNQEVEIKEFPEDEHKIKEGDLILYKDIVYRFDGYEYGTYVIATNLSTEEQVYLPHY
jgi:hypothetical protein